MEFLKKARHEKILSKIQEMAHGSLCDKLTCTPVCDKMKRIISHLSICPKKTPGGCKDCKQILALCCYHAKICRENNKCSIPYCESLKRKMAKDQMRGEAGNWKRLRQDDPSRPVRALSQPVRIRLPPMTIQVEVEQIREIRANAMEGLGGGVIQLEAPAQIGVLNPINNLADRQRLGNPGRNLDVNFVHDANGQPQNVVINRGIRAINLAAENNQPPPEVFNPVVPAANQPGPEVANLENNPAINPIPPVNDRHRPVVVNPVMPPANNQLEPVVANPAYNRAINPIRPVNDRHHPVVVNPAMNRANNPIAAVNDRFQPGNPFHAVNYVRHPVVANPQVNYNPIPALNAYRHLLAPNNRPQPANGNLRMNRVANPINPRPYPLNNLQHWVASGPANCPCQPAMISDAPEPNWRDYVSYRLRKRQRQKLLKAAARIYPPGCDLTTFGQRLENTLFHQATSLSDFYRLVDNQVNNMPRCMASIVTHRARQQLLEGNPQ